MNGFPSKERLEAWRKQYPVGATVELVSMDDPYTKLRPGDRGVIDFIDDAGSCHIRWDRGSSLAAVLGHDVIRLVMEDAK